MAARQEVLNVLLAQLLQDRGLVAAPEQILRAVENGDQGNARMPDVLVDLQGLRVAIEAEFASTANAERQAYDKARLRVEQGIAHVGVAVVYPAGLRRIGFRSQRDELAASTLRFAIITEAASGPVQGELFPDERPPEEPAPDFDRGGVNNLAEALRRSYEQLVQDETLQQAVERMEGAIAAFLAAMRAQPASTERIAVALGMRQTRTGKPLEELPPKERRAVNRIGGLIVINAMIFQEVLSQKNSRVRPLRQFTRDADPVEGIRAHWRFVLDEINYHPIFNTAHGVLDSLAADTDMRHAVSGMVRAALWVVGRRASLRHDLAGRIFHRILAEAKYLGAYYTAIPSAIILLKLAMGRNGGSFDWSDLEAIRRLTVADMACGTGTLLMAAADAVLDNYLRARGESPGRSPDPDELQALHSALVEKIIHGFDVLPSAVHLTASTLALRVPDAPINVTNLSCLRLGGTDRDLGSLEFFERRRTAGTLFSRPSSAEGASRAVSLPDVDLCVMNPPFTSSRQPNLLFGNIPQAERQQMQRRLQQVVRRGHIPASITAGLAAVFTALADRYVKPGGRLALVLPRAILNGAAWQKTRDLLAEGYRLEYLVCSHAPGQWNFSENTKFSEVLLVGRKRREGEEPQPAEGVTCVNLWAQPKNAVEALSLAHSLENPAPDLESGQGALRVAVTDRKCGEALSVNWAALRLSPSWGLPCAFAQSELARMLYHLQVGELYLPGRRHRDGVPLRPLSDYGQLGPDPRDVEDGFDTTENRTAYPALMGHDQEVICCMRQRPNQYLEPLAAPRPRRPLRRAADLWPRAGRLLLVQRVRLTTKKLLAIRASEKVLSDVWWPLALRRNGIRMEDTEKALVLWLNSTLAFLLLLGVRDETEGAWVQFKKPSLRRLPVIDLHKIGDDALSALVAEYDRLADEPFGPLPSLASDPARAAVDAAVARALGLPELAPARELLANEPLLRGDLSGLGMAGGGRARRRRRPIG